MADLKPTMKRYVFVKRRDDVSFEDFKRYWLEQHSRIVQMIAEKNPSVKKILAIFPVDSTEELPWDGIAEIYFDPSTDLEFNRQPLNDEFREVIARLLEDEEHFIDHSVPHVRVHAEEYLIAAPEAH